MKKDIDLIMSNSLSLDRQTGGLYLEPSTETGKEVTDI